MEISEIAQAIGELRAKTTALDDRLTQHMGEDAARHEKTLQAVNDIRDMLSQATGARKLLVWIIGILIAAVAISKGWIFGGKP